MNPSLSSKKLNMIKKEYSRMPEGSLNIKCYKGYYSFYHFNGSRQVCINSNRTLVHQLARKKYLYYLTKNRDTSQLLDKYVSAGLVLQMITLTPKQYRWVTASYPANTGWKEDLKFVTTSGIPMRSKSERDIGNELELLGVPYRYEMLFKINVSMIVDGLRDYLSSRKNRHDYPRSLFTYRDGHCIWNVPEDLQWMNAPGSIWRSYDYRTQTITISVDFAIMLGDGSILLWEHAGLCMNPIYRCNTSERIFVLKTTDFVPNENIIFTTEKDLLDISDIERLISREILPRL